MTKHIAEGVQMTSAASIILNDGRIQGLDTALISAATDGASKGYVDSVAQGLKLKAAVKATGTVADGNIDVGTGGLLLTLDTSVDIDTDGDRVLLRYQTNAAQNGIWVAHSGAWTRPTDFAAGAHASGSFCFVEQGSLFADTGWVCSTDAPLDVIGTNDLDFVQFSSAGVITVGNGLQQVGNVISAKADDGISVSGTGITVRLAATSGLSKAGGELVIADAIAGNGLTIASKVLAVGAGSGISVAADAVSLGALTADWDAGGYEIRALTFESDVATGTAPFVVASTTVVTNLNADQLDGQDGSYYAVAANVLLKDGTVPLTAAWDAGSFQIRAETFQSDVATGTAPFTVASSTVVTNLNADTVDGIQGSVILVSGGTVPLTADWDAGAFEIRALTFESDVATGTAPFTIASTTVVTNLNADKLDGQDGSYYAVAANVLLKDGTVPLTAAWDAGSFQIRAETFQSDIATGTAPFTVASTTVVTNLNADKLDGYDASAFLLLAGGTMAGDLNMGAFDITNVDTISTLANGNITLAPNGTGYTVTTKDVRIDSAGAGLILKDSGGTYWRIGITTDGVLTATSL